MKEPGPNTTTGKVFRFRNNTDTEFARLNVNGEWEIPPGSPLREDNDAAARVAAWGLFYALLVVTLVLAFVFYLRGAAC